MKRKVFNFAWGNITAQWNEAEATAPAELMVYENIGSDPWDGKGLTATDFKEALGAIPKDRDLHLRVNSRGGDVHEGMAIKSMIDEWPKGKVATIDGIAASTASWMILGCDEVRAFPHSQMFIHDAIGMCWGNAEEMESTAGDLDKTSNQIAGLYATKTGKGVRTMRQLMQDETLMTGEEAEELGLVDKLIDGKAVRNFTPKEITQMSNRLKAIYNSAAKPGAGQKEQHHNTMNKAKIIAILNKAGLTEWDGKPISDATSDEHLEAALQKVLNETKTKLADKPAPGVDNSELIKLQNQISKLTEANDAAKKLRIASEIDGIIKNDQLPAALKDKAIARAMADESYLNELRSLPVNQPGGRPAAAIPEISGEASMQDISKHILNQTRNLTRRMLHGEDVPMSAISNGARAVARFLNGKDGLRLREMLNTTTVDSSITIDSDLERIVILQDMVAAFRRKLAPITAFSTVFLNVPLEGTDKVGVPYFPLQTQAATSWVAATGYVATSATQQLKEITVNQRQYIGLTFSSQTMRRQPWVNLQQLGIMNAEQLAVTVFQAICSAVTPTNFTGDKLTETADGFVANRIADLWAKCDNLNWPDVGRTLVISSTYYATLLKDPAFKSYLAAGTTDALRKAQIQEAYGFADIYRTPNIPSNSVNLTGFAAHKSGLAVATAPIAPTPDVRALMTAYDLAVDAEMGIALEYRRYGDPQKDVTNEFVECNYGYGPVNPNGIIPVVSA